MLKLAVVALALCPWATALRMTPGGMKLKEHEPDHKLPICKNTEDLSQRGKWVKLDQKVFDKNFIKPGQQPGCKEERKMWQPNNCNLPLAAKDVKSKPRRFVFIGDSVQDISAESFAWFIDRSTPNKNCSYTGDTMKTKLLKQGFSQQTTDHTVEFIQRQLTKGHRWWGCSKKDKVSYIPMHRMPDMHAENMFPALMFAIKHFGEQPIGKEDVLVVNWGLHYTNMQHAKKAEMAKATTSLKLILDEYAKWEKQGDAPKLIWRQVSPQHWGGLDGTYSNFHEVLPTCHAIAGPKALDNLMKRTDVFRHRNDKMFEDAVEKAGLKIDGEKIAVLPVWRASAERFDEHVSATSEKAEADCTHYCTHGAVNRLWNSGLLALCQDMKQKSALPPSMF